MAIIGGTVGYQLLRRLAPGGVGTERADVASYDGVSKLRTVLGEETIAELRDARVLDFGCGEGSECLQLLQLGVSSCFGLDIQEDKLAMARRRAADAGVADRCAFGTSFEGTVDAIVSFDAFEHFSDPAHILTLMASYLRVNGRLHVSFGPTWYHPLGGHLFSVFPWAHLIFTERALIRWRSDFKNDGATRFDEVAGGLNRMTISRFETLVRESPHFELQRLTPVPIRKLAPLHNRLTREFTSAIVQATLRRV